MRRMPHQREVAKRIRVEAELLQEFHIMQKMACKFLLYCYNNTVTFFRLVGQVVKTPPSQGGIRGSIPLRTLRMPVSVPKNWHKQ